MLNECNFCSALGLYCVSHPNKVGREARVAEVDQPLIGVEEPISACRVLPQGKMPSYETDQTPNWDGLSVFIMALFNAGLLKDKEIKRIQERAGGALYGRAVRDAIVYAVNQILERAEFNQNGATEHTSARSLESIESALRHPDLTWLIDPRYEIVVSKKYTQGVVFVGELLASLSEEIKQRLPDTPDTLLHILVKSNQNRVNLDLKELASKCAFTKNSHLLDRDPRKRPFCVLAGLNDELAMGAHLSYQVLAQVLHHNLGYETEAIRAVLEQMPFSLVQAMKKLIEHDPRDKGQPACIKEMSSMLMILDGFSKRGILSKRKSHKPVIDWRIQLILDEVNAYQGIQPANGGVSRFATSSY